MDYWLKQQILAGLILLGVVIGIVLIVVLQIYSDKIVHKALFATDRKTLYKYRFLTFLGATLSFVPALVAYDTWPWLIFLLLFMGCIYPMHISTEIDSAAQKKEDRAIAYSTKKSFKIFEKVSTIYLITVLLGFLLSILYYPWYYFCGGFLCFEDQSFGSIVMDFIMSVIALLYVLATLVLIFKR